MSKEIQQAIYVTVDVTLGDEIIARAGDIFHDGNATFYFIVSERPTSYRIYSYNVIIGMIASNRQPI